MSYPSRRLRLIEIDPNELLGMEEPVTGHRQPALMIDMRKLRTGGFDVPKLTQEQRETLIRSLRNVAKTMPLVVLPDDIDLNAVMAETSSKPKEDTNQ